jgi:hypothetical protein
MGVHEAHEDLVTGGTPEGIGCNCSVVCESVILIPPFGIFAAAKSSLRAAAPEGSTAMLSRIEV